MQLYKLPKNDKKYYWTNHVLRKMLYYGLSPDRVKRIISSPKRRETGVAENTVAVMQPTGTKIKPTEVWAMYQVKPKSGQKVIITAWRYPAISPIRDQIPIPRDIIEELRAEGVIK